MEEDVFSLLIGGILHAVQIKANETQASDAEFEVA